MPLMTPEERRTQGMIADAVRPLEQRLLIVERENRRLKSEQQNLKTLINRKKK